VHSEDAERASVCQANGLDLNIGFNLVTHQGGAPVQVLGSQNDWFLVGPVLQDRYVKRLV